MSEQYPFTRIKEEITKRNGAALDFAIGTSPFPLSPEMSGWLRTNSELALVPANREDINEFTLVASGYLSRQYGVEISPDHILPTAGGRAAMGILAACTLSPESTVVVTEPGYPAFARLAKQAGAKVVVSHLEPGSGFAPDFEYSDGIPRGSVSMLAVNYPNNPSGGMLSPVVREKLKYLASPGLVLFNDATYGPLVYNDNPRSLLSGVFHDGNQASIIELHSFSKLYAIGPLAVSFLAGPADLLRSMATYSEYAWSPLSRLQLLATAKCLQDGDRIARFRDYLPPRLRTLQSALDDIGLQTFTSNSGTYLVCSVPKSIAGKAITSAQSAARYLMEEFDIAVVPIGNDDHAYLRFSALYRPQDLERLAGLGPKLQFR